MIRNHLLKVVLLTSIALCGGKALADDLVAAVLPLSRSPTTGQTATAFATIINTSGKDLTGCGASLPNFNGSFSFNTTNSTTNAIVGASNATFPLATGASQSMVLALRASGTISPTEEHIVFQCANSNAANSISGVDTLKFTVNSPATADIVALAATPTNDGILHMGAVNTASAFAVASVNVGANNPNVFVTADTGAIALPVTVSMCQTNPANGTCNATPSASLSGVAFAANATPTFSFFVTPTAPIPSFPAGVRLFVKFKTSAGTTVGSTSIALQNSSTLAAGQTAGGIFTGTYVIASESAATQSIYNGDQVGTTGNIELIVTEAGTMFGEVLDPGGSGSIDTVYSFTGLTPTSTFALAGTGAYWTSDGSPSSVTMSLNAVVSPQSFIAGLYNVTGESGEFVASYNSGLYQRASSLATVAGSWNLRQVGSGQAIGTVTISSTGAITGSASSIASGCSFTGSISTINTSYNVYSMTLSPTSACGTGVGGSYTGVATVFDGQSANDSINMVVVNTANQNNITTTLTKY